MDLKGRRYTSGSCLFLLWMRLNNRSVCQYIAKSMWKQPLPFLVDDTPNCQPLEADMRASTHSLLVVFFSFDRALGKHSAGSFSYKTRSSHTNSVGAVAHGTGLFMAPSCTSSSTYLPSLGHCHPYLLCVVDTELPSKFPIPIRDGYMHSLMLWDKKKCSIRQLLQ
jgi:hypothetical protein